MSTLCLLADLANRFIHYRLPPRPISIAVLRPINGGHEKNDDDLNEGVDSANRIATVNGYRHDCWLLFDLVRWLRARDLLVLPSSLRIWQGGPTL
jgi:hypothetical protein